jgi:predicted enzyme related to lactoylglutathione lyase
MILEHVISWFEIPATDLNRATKFYETILATTFSEMNLENIRMRIFQLADPMKGVGGAIVESGGFHRPSTTDGPLIYLNGTPDVQIILDKVETAGGSILVAKTEISPEYGFMAVIIDTEGNRVGLHST